MTWVPLRDWHSMSKLNDPQNWVYYKASETPKADARKILVNYIYFNLKLYTHYTTHILNNE